MLDQAESLRKLAQSSNPSLTKKGKIITITSGKGGVGKSNFVVNLGIHLQKMGKKVLIFDADIGMANDDVLMGISSRYNIFDVINNNKNLNEVLATGPFGIKLLPGGSGLNKVEDLSDEEREVFLSKISEIEDFDYIFMDTGAGINRTVLAFISCCDELIVITTPEPTSLTDAYSLLKATSHFKIKDRANVVVNKALSYKEGEETFLKFENVVNKFLNMNLKYFGCVLEDKKLVQAVREQMPFIVRYPGSDAAECIQNIGNHLLGSAEKENGTGVQGLFKKIFKIFS
jgi:flagellar biosynthesis protein FlhG